MLGNRYQDNFDEFGNLRTDHSPWTVRDLCGVCAAVLFVVLIASGVFA